MSGRRHKPEVKIDVQTAAARLGLTQADLLETARAWLLDPTYSVQEVAKHFGCGVWQVHQLIALGRKHGRELHPDRGGLWPTFRTSRKCRRITLSAIERHKQHLEESAA